MSFLEEILEEKKEQEIVISSNGQIVSSPDLNGNVLVQYKDSYAWLPLKAITIISNNNINIPNYLIKQYYEC